MNRTERRKSMAERRPSTTYTPNVIPQLAGLEKPQNQYLEIDNCDVLILGTGLQESILASILAWQGSQVLHIDKNNYYGDSSCTLTIEQSKKWSNEVNQGKIPHFQEAKFEVFPGGNNQGFNSKDFGIDLTPKIMFCQSDLLTFLIKSRVYRYLEFQSLSNFHVFENDDFLQKINSTTKQDIFIDKSLSLMTKRNLMKFLKFVLIESNETYKEKIKNWINKPIQEFLKNEFKLEDPQINELVYAIGLSTKQDLNTKEALIRIKRFLSSFDIYGKFPCMVSKYGGPGELSQGFCRSSAVAGGIYKLNTKLADFDPELKIGHFDDGSHIKINEKVIISSSQIPHFLQSTYNQITHNLKKNYISRLTVIVNSSSNKFIQNNESSAVLVFPPFSLEINNTTTIQCLIQNHQSEICSKGTSIWYFSTTTNKDVKINQKILQFAFEKMFNKVKIDEPNLEIIYKLQYNQETYIANNLLNVFKPTIENNIILKSNNETSPLIFTSPPSGEISYDGIMTDVINCYSQITGDDNIDLDLDSSDEEDNKENEIQQYQPIDAVTGMPRKKSSVSGGIVGGGSSTNLGALNEHAIESSDEDEDEDEEMNVNDDDDDQHQPFGVHDMEL
ncbi:unnamed protein product [Candida verbasci]|uniref:Rab proteins geranylgeranyltransferase n=1 Tax=Candida verbasci TaxID=1227364 RepID=A0A9W4TVQ6_9ASCO|nr:unnamed protein product [Candida verbasci]